MRALALLVLISGRSAFAGTQLHLAASHEWAVPMESGTASLGPGIAAHAGPSFSLKLARIIPEIGASYHYQTGVLVPRAGGRLILGWLITPGVYAHANTAIGGVFAEPTFGFDAGASLHLSIPYLRVGGYGGIEVFGGQTGPTIPDQNFVGGIEIALAIPLKKEVEEEQVPEPPLPPLPTEPQPIPPTTNDL